MAQNTKQHPSLGAMPKSKGGSNRRLDHPSNGTMPTRQNNKTMSATKHAGGKPHPNLGSVPRSKNPAPVYYSNAGRGRAK